MPRKNREERLIYFREYNRRPGIVEKKRMLARARYHRVKESSEEIRRRRQNCVKMDARRRAAMGVLKHYMGGCMDCGFNGHPAALDFDHRVGTDKCKNIGGMLRYPWAKILTEISKCDLVCANCHRIRTVRRFQ